MPDGGVADGWETPDCSSVYRIQKLPPTNPRGSVIVCSDICQDLRAASGPGSLVRHGPGQSQSVDPCPLTRAAGGAPYPWRCPARSLTALAQRLGVSEADAATVVVPLEEEPAPVAPIPAAAPASPLLPMTGRHDASSAPRTLLNSTRVIAARKKTTRSKMSCSSMPRSSSSF